MTTNIPFQPEQSYPSSFGFRRRVLHQERADGTVKHRAVFEPAPATRMAHDHMLDYFYLSGIAHDDMLASTTFVGGGMPDSQLLDNIEPHRDNTTFYLLDLSNAFPSVDIPTLKTKLSHEFKEVELGKVLRFIDHHVATDLVSGLPQGAPCSPFLFNFYLKDMDRALDAFCSERNLTYTRWLDDISISSPERDNVLGEKTRRSIRKIIESTPGMQINHRKSHVYQRVERPVTITGVSLYPDGRVQPRREIVNDALETFGFLQEFLEKGGELDPHELGLLHGYYGALLSMSLEPRGPTIRTALRQHETITRMARGAFDLSEPDSAPEPITPVRRPIGLQGIISFEQGVLEI